MNHELKVYGFGLDNSKTHYALHFEIRNKRHIDISSTEYNDTICIFNVNKQEMYYLAQQLIGMGNKMEEN